MSASKPWLALVGPTASGKTAAALALAHQLAPIKFEIISLDSALVYRFMDIGTAKPSHLERQHVPHHLIDIIDPTDTYSAARFVADAQALITQIHDRGAWPLVVGGTMLYLKALMQGLDAMPSADLAMREIILEEAGRLGWPALHAQLAQVDPITAQRLSPYDAQRISRALEVWRSTGVALSHFHGRVSSSAWQPCALVSLEPIERSWLHNRIEQRMKTMLMEGFIEEMHKLRAMPGMGPDLPAMRSVGYRQAWLAMDEGYTAEALFDSILVNGAAATRQLAKRQLTWLRSFTGRHVVACDQPFEQMLAAIKKMVIPIISSY